MIKRLPSAICVFILLAGGLTMIDEAKTWDAVEQPELERQLENAPLLKPEELGTAVYGLDDPRSCGISLVPNPDEESYDVLLWYREAYRKNQRIYIVDLGSGEVRIHRFLDEEGDIRVDQGFTWFGALAANGKLYGGPPDWSKLHAGGGVVIYEYDPAENAVSRFMEIPGVGGERNPMMPSPNGWVYGAGTYLKQDEGFNHHSAAFGFDPETGETRFYGPIGPRILGSAYAYSAGVCDTHIYVASGQIPWYLLAVDIQTGEWKVLDDAPEGGYRERMVINSSESRYFGGAVAYVQKSDDAPRNYYWLYRGEMIPKKTAGWEMDDSCPWPADLRSPRQSAPPPPQLYTQQLYPDENGRATLWWRPAEGGDWRDIALEDVEKHPLTLHRFFRLPEGRMFGTAQGYKGRFLFDPDAERVIQLGDAGGSLYALAWLGDRLYWSGYPFCPVYSFDPERPWILGKGVPLGEPPMPNEASLESNPRRVHEDRQAFFNKTRVSKMLSATVAADNRIYFGGKGQRDYQGGGLAWYDPATGEIDGMWEPFRRRDIGWLTTACEGRYVCIGANGDRLFILDTETRELDYVVPVEGAEKSGVFLEVAPGRLLGITHDPDSEFGGVMFGMEVPSGEIFFRKRLPWSVGFRWAEGTRRWDYLAGPDGHIWTTLGRGGDANNDSVLVRIDPSNGHVEIIGRLLPPGRMEFLGRDLYITGTTQIRRLKNIAVNNK